MLFCRAWAVCHPATDPVFSQKASYLCPSRWEVDGSLLSLLFNRLISCAEGRRLSGLLDEAATSTPRIEAERKPASRRATSGEGTMRRRRANAEVQSQTSAEGEVGGDRLEEGAEEGKNESPVARFGEGPAVVVRSLVTGQVLAVHSLGAIQTLRHLPFPWFAAHLDNISVNSIQFSPSSKYLYVGMDPLSIYTGG